MSHQIACFRTLGTNGHSCNRCHRQWHTPSKRSQHAGVIWQLQPFWRSNSLTQENSYSNASSASFRITEHLRTWLTYKNRIFEMIVWSQTDWSKYNSNYRVKQSDQWNLWEFRNSSRPRHAVIISGGMANPCHGSASSFAWCTHNPPVL